VSIHRICLPLASALLASCAGMPADRGRSDVAELLSSRGQVEQTAVEDREAIARLVGQLTARPLAVTEAVRIALVNNPALRAEYSELGLAAADVYEAGRLSNPRLSASLLFVDEPGLADKIDLGLSQSFTDLLLLSARSRFAEGAFERTKALVGAAVLELAATVERTYYELAGARQLATMRGAVAHAASASAELAGRFHDAGNIDRRQLALERAAAVQAQLDADTAQLAARRAQIELGRLLGLSNAPSAWGIAAGMPMPLAREDALDALLRRAETARLDLLAQRKLVSLQADSLGVTRRFRYLGDIEVGINAERDTDRSNHLGPSLSLELPLFNQNADKVVRAEAKLQRAEAELAALELEIAADIHEAYAQVVAAKTRADRYRQGLIPLREEIVARTQEQVNYMLVGQFDLLLMKQQEYDGYQGYIEAVRDYWQARADLSRAVGATLPSSAQGQTGLIDADAVTRPKSDPMPNNSGAGTTRDHGSHGDSAPGAAADAPGPDPHAGHAPGAAPEPAKQPARRESKPRSQSREPMPTGMESHIPKSAGEPSEPAAADKKDAHQHGDH